MPETLKSPGDPLSGLVHSKVPLGAWLAESFVFAGRYFPRLLLLGSVLALFFIGAVSPQGTLPWDDSRCGVSCGVGVPSEAPASDVKSRRNLSKAELRELIIRDMESRYLAPRRRAPSSPLRRPVSCALFVLLWWMTFSWGIRTLRKDSGSWKHLLFPSRTALPKLVLLTVLAAGLGAAVLKCVWLSLARLNDTAAIAAALLVGILLLAKFGLSAHLVIDRNMGPVRAAGTSWKFTRSSTGTLIVGAALLFLAWIALWLAFNCSIKPVFGTTGFCRLSTAGLWYFHGGLFVISALAALLAAAMAPVFYLTATGQPRPGARRRAAGPSAEDSAISV